MKREDQLRRLEERLAYRFKDRGLLERALTHKSRGDGQPGFAHNERLEWLGDRVLGLMTAERLFELHGRAEEGELTRQFAAIVSGRNCAEAARILGLTDLMVVSKSISLTSLAHNDSILGDACEAVIAALWLDGGRPAVEALFDLVWQTGLSSEEGGHRNPKNALQEWAQKRGLPAPIYEVVSREGPDHAPNFVIEVQVGPHIARAEGTSKQNAERAAAQYLLKQGGLRV
ncbi:ribonuclease 3 [Candidatus Phycosocius bacilliformis]|uniref:Ribonuclease 3 n=1 Tax=Candidatus Phycosocius bacilliformis TaxID=1445552 RepID=A0A2P2E874_9PROT|nr:ribonuclease III [Candidatus Phycosocius bacilliformis]GBF57247.1 ribonuclease 3 [Candidatus Phycosocius bacilliformis]